MMAEALRIASGYNAVVCNPHNPHNSELAPVLWLFYVSKVRGGGRRNWLPTPAPL